MQLKQIICFILLLNHVRAHTMLAGENPAAPPSPLSLKQYNQASLLLNERVRVKSETTQNHQYYADDNEKNHRKIRETAYSIADRVTHSTMFLPEKIDVFGKTDIITNDEKTYYMTDKKRGDVFLKMPACH